MQDNRPTYSIREWDTAFETHESRKLKRMIWVAVPNSHEGKGFRRLASRPDKVEVFCAFQLIVEVASKMPVRGVLADEDGPLTAEDLSYMTGFPIDIFENALTVLSGPPINWLQCDGGNGNGSIPAYSAPTPAASAVNAAAPAAKPPNPGPTKTKQNQDKTVQKPPKGGTRLPEPFELTPAMRNWAVVNTPGLDLDWVRDQFVDYWRARAGPLAKKEDWQATWRNWLRRTYEEGRGGAGVPPPQSNTQQTETEEERDIRQSCGLCYGTGMVIGPNGAKRCDHGGAQDDDNESDDDGPTDENQLVLL